MSIDTKVVRTVNKRWEKLIVSTEPADREHAVKGVVKAYKSGGYHPPKQAIWCASPLAGAVHAIRLREKEGIVDLSLSWRKRSPWLSTTQRYELNRLLAAHAVERVNARVWDHVWGQLRRQVRGHLKVLDSCMAYEQLPDLLMFDYLERTGVSTPYRGHLEVAYTAGWWFPLAFTVVLCERPRSILCDNRGMLHNANGPAVEYIDGWSIWAWHGVVVPASVILHPERTTVGQIDNEHNSEVRRVMIERMGPERYMRESGATLVHQDDWGKLWRTQREPAHIRDWDDEPVMMVEVLNSTPEPDGTFKTYWLRVPPTMQTAHQAVAWTYEMSDDEYHPQIQT